MSFGIGIIFGVAVGLLIFLAVVVWYTVREARRRFEDG